MARVSVKREAPITPPIVEVTLVLTLEEAVHLYKLVGDSPATDLNWRLFNVFKEDVFDDKLSYEVDFPEQS